MYNRMEHCNNGAQTCLHYCKEKHVDWQLIDKGRQFTIYSYYAKNKNLFAVFSIVRRKSSQWPHQTVNDKIRNGNHSIYFIQKDKTRLLKQYKIDLES